MPTTIEDVKKITAETLKIDEGKVTDTSDFVNDLGASSLQSIELIAALEAHFDVEIDEDEAMEITSVDGAAAFIDKLLKDA